MTTVPNPILRGFNPDPSIVRVGDDYFIATSTFEWFPGVRLHHSRDLAHWEVVGHALDQRGGFDLSGVPDSGGIWAPSLSFADGRFWLAYSVVRTMDGDDLDIDNYLVTAPEIGGPWTTPVHLGSRGFDFSFFHDTDGTHWIVGVQWDHRPGHDSFAGIVIEQFLPESGRTSGLAHTLYRQSTLVEGPNLYHTDDGYLLLLAEGGTGWNHGITAARSASLLGPYERDAEPAVLTSRDAPGLTLQKAGHGELVQTPTGEWMLVHLASRPTLAHGERYSTLGRETCLQPIVFDEGWPRLKAGGHHPAESFEISDPAPTTESGGIDEFDAPTLDTTRWSTLRTALDADLSSRPGWLRLHGGHSAGSVFSQAMIAQRVEEHRLRFEAIIDAQPTGTRQAAGIVAWYGRSSHIWLQLTWDAENGRHLRVVERHGQTRRSPAIRVPDGVLRLRLQVDGPELRFAVASAEGPWSGVPGVYEAWRLSDDHPVGALRFTGLMVGLRAEDLDGGGWFADFDSATISVEQGRSTRGAH